MKLLLIFALVGCVAAQAPRTIIESLEEAGQTTILDLIKRAGLTEALSGEGPFTAFVPKQDVLDNLPQEILDMLLNDVELLTKGLTYHVATGTYMSSDLADDITVPTVQGTPLRVNVYSVGGNTVATVAGVPIDLTMVDIDAGNGVIHYLDYIILDVPDFDTVGTLQNIEGATFEALLYAAESTDLVGAVVEAEGLTLLAPIDSDGFNVAVIDELLADPDALAAILKDHIIGNTLYSVGLELDTPYETFGGNTIRVSFNDETGFFVSDADGNLLADIIAGDISTTQGVVHLLDRPIIL